LVLARVPAAVTTKEERVMRELGIIGAAMVRRGLLVKLVTAAALGVCALLFAYDSARAAVTSVSVVSATELGEFDHRAYREVELRLVGTAPGGGYDVPVTLAYPTDDRDYSGVAVVDVVNTVFMVFPAALPAPATPDPSYTARDHLSDAYLFGSGHVYVSVIWDKAALALAGTGIIAERGDAFSIIRDVAGLARDPSRIPAQERPNASGTVIAYGMSQTAGVLRHFYREHANSTGGLAFDGALYSGAAGRCLDPALGSFGTSFLCGDGPVSDGGKVIALSSETDAQLFGYSERGQTPDYRLMETAGTAHIPASALVFVDAPAQNPASWTPVARASMSNLIAWIGGTTPPDSNYITLEEDVGELLGGPFREPIRDADGNALGGVRLPHMTVTDKRHEIGAPLGTYEGFEFNTQNFFILLAGHFTPFDAARLEALYPSHDAYVQRVTKAAHRLVQRRELLQEDAKAIIKEATHSSVGK
jgi:hypothetical protein